MFNKKTHSRLGWQGGYSLVELVIVLALLGVILAIGYNFYFYTTQAFKEGEKQAAVQQNVRVVADFITKELRYASIIQILDSSASIPAAGSIFDDFNYIFINSTGSVEHRSKTGSRIIFSSDINQSKITQIEFNIGNSGDRALAFNISGTHSDGTHPFSVTSEILGENLAMLGFSVNDLFGSSSDGFAVRYIKDLHPIPSLSAMPFAIDMSLPIPEITLVLTAGKFTATVDTLSHEIKLGGHFADAGFTIGPVSLLNPNILKLQLVNPVATSSATVGTITVPLDLTDVNLDLTTEITIINP